MTRDEILKTINDPEVDPREKIRALQTAAETAGQKPGNNFSFLREIDEGMYRRLAMEVACKAIAAGHAQPLVLAAMALKVGE